MSTKTLSEQIEEIVLDNYQNETRFTNLIQESNGNSNKATFKKAILANRLKILQEITNRNNLTNQLNADISNLTQLVQNISGIDTAVSILDISTNFYNFKNIFENAIEISNNIINFKKDISLNSNIYNYNNQTLTELQELDNSNNLLLNLSQINELIDSKNFSNNPGSTITVSNEFVNDMSQSFFEIMTQQPQNFDSSGIPNSLSTSQIVLSWNYDKIIPKHLNTYDAQLAFFSNLKDKSLPFIDYIIIEISGNVNSNPTGWIELTNIIIPSNTSYNQDLYKTYTINKYTDTIGSVDYSKNSIISSLNNFDLRIYGVNNSENYPNENTRSLYFNNIAFKLANPPSQPIFINNSNIQSNSGINLNYSVNFIENGETNTNANLNYYAIDYSQNNTLASIIYPIVNTTNELSNNFSPLEDNSFTINLTNLRSGTKYNHRVKVKNSLNDLSFSEYSIINDTSYTRLPTSGIVSDSLDLNINSNSYTFISNNNDIDNSNVIYINKFNGKSIQFTNLSNQTIEISHPYTNNQQTLSYGYGKYIDNSLDLVNLSVSVNNILKQKISFDGSFSSTSGNINDYNSNSFHYIELGISTSLQDIYQNDDNCGFRLKGTLKLNNISNSEIVNAFGDPSTNPYILNLTYNRHQHVNNTNNQDKSYNIYIDDLSLQPTLNANSTNSNVVDVVYNFGIPSVSTFKLDFIRTYKNINSQYNYIPGDNRIASIYSIIKTSLTSLKNITINPNIISSSGIYNFDNSIINSKTNDYYQSINYTTSLLTTNNNLNWNEYAYSLISINGSLFDQQHNTNHYCDYNSFNKSNNKITTSKINLNDISVCEISNIELIGSDLVNLQLLDYTDHTKQVLDHTLLYIDGRFQANSDKTYPNIQDFSYNGVTITNDFSAGNIGYDLQGNRVSDNTGYKWIAFKIFKNFSLSNTYVFNGINYTLQISDEDNKYLDITNILLNNNLFDPTTIDNMFNNTSDEVLGFSRVTRKQDNKVLIGNLKQEFSGVGGNWYLTGSSLSTISYNNTLQLNYGAQVIDTNTTGLYINITGILDDLTLFIGLKN